jgi:hypothetical protein
MLPGSCCNNAVCGLDIRVSDFLHQFNVVRSKFVREYEDRIPLSGVIDGKNVDLSTISLASQC